MPETYELISSTTLGSNSATVTLSNIPGTYTDLVLVSSWKSPSAGLGNISLSLRFNSDSTSGGYSITNMVGTGGGTNSNRTSNASMIILNYTGSPYTNWNVFTTNIMNYSDTSVYKSVVGRDSNPTGGVGAVAGLWRNTNAITSITMLDDSSSTGLAAGSTFNLYGIKAA